MLAKSKQAKKLNLSCLGRLDYLLVVVLLVIMVSIRSYGRTKYRSGFKFSELVEEPMFLSIIVNNDLRRFIFASAVV